MEQTFIRFREHNEGDRYIQLREDDPALPELRKRAGYVYTSIGSILVDGVLYHPEERVILTCKETGWWIFKKREWSYIINPILDYEEFN